MSTGELIRVARPYGRKAHLIRVGSMTSGCGIHAHFFMPRGTPLDAPYEWNKKFLAAEDVEACHDCLRARVRI